MSGMREKSADEIVAWLQGHVDVREVPLESFSSSFLDSLRQTIASSVYARHENGDLAALHFRAFSLLGTERNRHYLALAGSGSSMTPAEAYAIIETTTGCAESNVAKLQLELTVARGASEADLANRTGVGLAFLAAQQLLADGAY